MTTTVSKNAWTNIPVGVDAIGILDGEKFLLYRAKSDDRELFFYYRGEDTQRVKEADFEEIVWRP